MEYLKIILLCILSAIAYGIVQDQITARICIEYFTIGHPRIILSEDPTLIALLWGVIATWWVGLFLGIPVVLASRIGNWPKLDAKKLLRPIAILLGFVGIASIIAGLIGNSLAIAKVVWLLEPLASRVPKEKHVYFLTDLWAHCASYGAGFIGGIILVFYIIYRRYKERRLKNTANQRIVL